MRKDRLKGRIDPDKPPIVNLHSDAPRGETAAIVIDSALPAPSESFASMAEFNAWLRKQPPTGRSREDVDQQIDAERNAYE